ncbi:hypothetical protein ASZ78_016831 [Callipepla squamata]|uniref:Uncharacterized protein n=1 Tax=Callipepla squamata TaxID=9009 RepID=A0A226N0B7_CALSU|nr:hypothetical protein ASZ78_016831 [Callipepla squamata]
MKRGRRLTVIISSGNLKHLTGLNWKPDSSVGFHINNELMEVIPSSNPNSQTDAETHYLLEKVVCKEVSTQEKYLKTDCANELKEQWQDLHVGDEFVFVDNLKNYQFCKSSNSKSDSIKNPSYLELKKLLNLAPETMADENMCEDVIKEDLKGKIMNKMEVSKYCPASVVRSTNSLSMLEISESANHISYVKAEIEVPLTPLCKQQRPQLIFLCEGLQEELNPLSGNSILITEPSMEYLDSLVWQSEKYWDNVISLLLVEHQRFKLESWHYSLTELKEMLSISVETPMFISLEEDWWLHMGFDLICIDTLEQLKWDSNSTNSLLSTEVETFTPFSTHHLERWPEEKNSMSDQEPLSTEIRQVDEINDLCTSPQTMMQPFGLPMNAASSLKIDRTNSSLEYVAGGSILKSNIEKPIYFLSQEEKTDKSLASVICKDVPFKQHNTSEGPKPASFTLDSKWDSGDSDLNDFIMLRCKHTVSQRQEKNGVDSHEKVLQPEEQHLPEHKGDSSVCEPVRTEKKEQENDNRVIVNIRASGKVDEKETMLFRHAALVHLLVTGRDLLLTCGLDTTLEYLSTAKDIYKNALESCLNNIWRQLKIVQYSSQKKHESSLKLTELQCRMLNWMHTYADKHGVKILIITRMESEREKAALIHTVTRIEGLKAIDLNSEKKGNTLSYKDIISKYSLKGDTLLSLVLIYATLIEFTQKSEDFKVKVVITPGIEETALLIRQIADNILLHCFHVKEDENHLGDNTRNSRLQQERIGDNNKAISVASYAGEMCPTPHSPSKDLTTELEIFVEAVVESNSMLLLECIPSLPALEY